MTHGSDTEDPRRNIQEVDLPPPACCFREHISLPHPQAPGQGRQEEEWSKGNRGHWKVRWGHKDPGAWERGRVDKRSGLMAQRTAMSPGRHKGSLGGEGVVGSPSGSSRGGRERPPRGWGGGWSSRHPANKPAATIPLLTGPKRANQKLLQGRLRAPYRQARTEGWGVHTHCGTPQYGFHFPLVYSNTTCREPEPRRPFTINAPTLGPLPPPVSRPHSPCQHFRESLSK